MRPLLLGFLTLVAAAACSSNNDLVTDSSPTTATSCTGADQCNPDQCVCTNGQTFLTPTLCSGGACSTGNTDSFCGTMCKDSGGVSAVRPAPNVASSPECDAWCERGAGLACGSTQCNRFFFCAVPKGSCEAAARAALKCATEKGTWECSKHSTSWSVTSSCGTFASLCDDASVSPSR